MSHSGPALEAHNPVHFELHNGGSQETDGGAEGHVEEEMSIETMASMLVHQVLDRVLQEEGARPSRIKVCVCVLVCVFVHVHACVNLYLYSMCVCMCACVYVYNMWCECGWLGLFVLAGCRRGWVGKDEWLSTVCTSA